MTMIEFILTFVASVFLCLVLILFFQIIFALLPRKQAFINQVRRAFAVLIPAHNEEQVLLATLQSILPQLTPTDRLLVVADNCSDRTAELAASAGAEVIERHDVYKRSKGFALDFGVRYLEQAPPEVVIILDADCLVASDALELLAKYCAEYNRPVQALDLMQSLPGAGLKARIAEFAWLVKNQVRPLGYLRMGLPCQLMGTGMAFPWELIRKSHLASGQLVEDIKLGVDLAAMGKSPLFCPDALVTSYFPSSVDGAQSQRKRWEHGHLSFILEEMPKLFVAALLKRDFKLFAMVLDLCVPPLALLVLLVLITLFLSLVLYLFSGIFLPFCLSVINLLLIGLSVLLAWSRFARKILSLSNLLLVPMYMLKKIPLYVQFCFNRQIEWVRADRNANKL